MRHFLKINALALLVLAALFFHAETAFSADPVRGVLENVQETENGWLITMRIDGQVASGLLAPECRYYVDRSEVEREIFFDRASGQDITVDVDQRAGVIRCYLQIVRLD
ncbi:MAG: hypothetical protein LBQ90_07255 [Synergistaceae bacterium]|jgi:hypothetical protein|nr:hypothetical protein [Synergistaceae bacterium]